MALDAAPARSARPGPSQRVAGALRKPARVTVDARDWDEAHIELSALRHDALAHCDYVEPRLDALYPVAIELDPRAEQLVAGCLNSVARLRKRATA